MKVWIRPSLVAGWLDLIIHIVYDCEHHKPRQATSVSFQVVLSRHKTVFDVRPSACLKPVWQATTTSLIRGLWIIIVLSLSFFIWWFVCYASDDDQRVIDRLISTQRGVRHRKLWTVNHWKEHPQHYRRERHCAWTRPVARSSWPLSRRGLTELSLQTTQCRSDGRSHSHQRL